MELEIELQLKPNNYELTSAWLSLTRLAIRKSPLPRTASWRHLQNQHDDEDDDDEDDDDEDEDDVGPSRCMLPLYLLVVIVLAVSS